jgi:hypothetical protein
LYTIFRPVNVVRTAPLNESYAFYHLTALHFTVFTEGQFFPEWLFEIDDILSKAKYLETQWLNAQMIFPAT